MGGSSPDVDLASIKDEYKYFFTIPVSKTGELSVFIADDFDKYWDNKGIVQSNGTGKMVRLMPRKPVARRLNYTTHCNYLPPLCLAMAAPSSDVADSDAAWSRHKLGGYPYCSDEKACPVAQTLMTSRHSLVMQLAFPGADDCDVNLNWPFSDGFFYIFSKGSRYSFMWT